MDEDFQKILTYEDSSRESSSKHVFGLQALLEEKRKLLNIQAYREVDDNLFVRFRVTLLEKLGPLLLAGDLANTINTEVSESWNDKHPLEFLACLQNRISGGKLESFFQQLKIDPGELLELAQFVLIEGERVCQKILNPLLYLKAQYVTMNGDGYDTGSFEPIDVPTTMISISHLSDERMKEKCYLIVKYLTEKLNY